MILGRARSGWAPVEAPIGGAEVRRPVIDGVEFRGSIAADERRWEWDERRDPERREERFALKIIILVALIRLLTATDKPLLCAGIYTGAGFFFRLVMGEPISTVLIGSAVALVLASLYFWLLYRLQGGILWWVVMAGGLLIGLV